MTQIASKSLYSGHVVKLFLDTVRLPNGLECDLEMIRHPGAAAVVPLDAEGNIIFVKQYRYATGGFILEIPAGKRDGNESPENCARRELSEETGYEAAVLLPLGFIWTTPGFTDEKIWLFLAGNLSLQTSKLDADEILSIEKVPLMTAIRMAEQGDICDSKSICALLRVKAVLKK